MAVILDTSLISDNGISILNTFKKKSVTEPFFTIKNSIANLLISSKDICYQAVFYKKGLHYRCFPENFFEIFMETVFENTFGRLLLKQPHSFWGPSLGVCNLLLRFILSQ